LRESAVTPGDFFVRLELSTIGRRRWSPSVGGAASERRGSPIVEVSCHRRRVAPRRSVGPSFQAGLDDLVDKMERRAVDHKEKPRVRARPIEEKAILRRIADGTSESGHERRIVKTKRFAIEPMFEEDAVAEMEDLGHGFYVFVDASTERIAVLYRRDDGDYGLIRADRRREYTRSRRAETSGRHRAAATSERRPKQAADRRVSHTASGSR
jgi:putative sigma-54 modulation protein